METLILEILDKHGKPLSRQRFTQFPVRIGRDYSNDLILDDEAVSPQHLAITLSEEGLWLVEDLHSENGTYAAGSKARLQQAPLPTDSVLHLGHTWLQLRSAASQVAPTVMQGGLAWRLNRLVGNLWFALGALLLFALYMMYNEYLGHADKVHASDFVDLGLTTLLAGLVWAAVWSLLSRLFSQRHTFREYLSFFALGMFALIAAGWVSDAATYMFPDHLLASLLGNGFILVVVAGICFLHLRFATRLKRWKIHAIVAALCGVGIALQVVSAYTEQHKFNDALQFDSSIGNVPNQILPYQDVEHFFADSRATRQDADENAKRD
ncbi:hypothetical protein IGB42_03181 [Andreprevotia sp. IGB-42]|uniref:FHA domain-containing protein n=1 Tax=Andreprevotia sp. IGB-42 TaxID=2497473 RepID=UPI00135B3901|nr:FHA domain-containing protein [Andreprevotia sp. IGB-42]KAF0812193.1 hypothetical protein IGB42_03181 [Andreprevotia sp. IGB-42]